MSKPIKFTQELIDQLRQEFDDALSKAKMVGGEFKFTRKFDSVDQKATLRFMERAYIKMIMLVTAFDKEVAWHFVASRGEAENEYLITDVLVYPQTVTGVTVEMDQEEYAKWRDEGVQSDDGRFFWMNGQGHSHVNMSTSPSDTDLKHQQGILDDLRRTGFYIFAIWNKKGEHTLWIYDLAKNIVFEDKDIKIEIGENDNEYADFIDAAKAIVKPRVQQYQNGGYASLGTTVKPANAVVPVKAASTKVEPVKQKNKVKAVVASAPRVNQWYDDDDYMDDPSSPFYVSDYYYGR